MIIDAMDILSSGRVDGFVLVSSDSDFTRLATRLREAGMKVYGMGSGKPRRPSSWPATNLCISRSFGPPGLWARAQGGGQGGRGSFAGATAQGQAGRKEKAEEPQAANAAPREPENINGVPWQWWSSLPSLWRTSQTGTATPQWRTWEACSRKKQPDFDSRNFRYSKADPAGQGPGPL